MTRPYTTPLRGSASDDRHSQPWTAERCHKLLRQLDSRLKALRRIVRNQEAAQDKCLRSEKTGNKRVRYTYGTKGTSTKSQTALGASTGALRGVRRGPFESPYENTDGSNMPPSSVTGASAGRKAVALDDLLESLRFLRNYVPSECFRVYEAIFDWLVDLLPSTQSHTETTHPKSLLSMCLRKLPACVDGIMTWQLENPGVADGPSSGLDVVLDLFTQIEKFGHQGLGWSPLKEAVRAQAVSQLGKAVTEGLFSPHYVGLLVKLLARLGCVPESARLATAVEVALPSPRSLDDDFRMSRYLAPLQALLEVTSSKGGYRGKRHVFGSVSHLLQEKRLPTSWLLTRGFRTILRRALTAMARGDGGPQCRNLLVNTIEALCCYSGGDGCDTSNDKPRMQVLIDIVSSLAALALGRTGLQTSETNETNTRTTHANVTRSVMLVLDQCVDVCGRRDRVCRESDSIMMVFAFARYCVASGHDPTNPALMRRQAQPVMYELLTGAPCRGLDSYYMLLLMIAMSQKISSSHGLSVKKAFSGLSQKLASLDMPEQFSFDIHDELLGEVGLDSCAIVSPRARPLIVSLQSSMSGDWCWEEGISEWVPATSRVTEIGNLVKRPKFRAYNPASGQSKPAQVSSGRDNRTHETVIHSPAPRPGSAGSHIHATVGGCLDMRGDGAKVTARESGWSRRDQALVGEPRLAMADCASQAACRRFDATDQEINTERAHLGGKSPLNIGFPGKENQIHRKGSSVHVVKDLITEPPNPRHQSNSVQVAAVSASRPATRRRSRGCGQLLVVSHNKQVGIAGRKRRRPPVKSHDLEADWDDLGW